MDDPTCHFCLLMRFAHINEEKNAKNACNGLSYCLANDDATDIRRFLENIAYDFLQPALELNVT